MLFQRRCNEQTQKQDVPGSVRFLMADASTQHGREIEHILLASVKKQDVGRLFFCAQQLLDVWRFGISEVIFFALSLWRTRNPPNVAFCLDLALLFCHSVLRQRVEDDDSEALDVEEELLASLREGIVEHHLPIMALGSGRTSLCDKFCCIAFAMMLEAGSSPACFSAFMQEILTGTFDL